MPLQMEAEPGLFKAIMLDVVCFFFRSFSSLFASWRLSRNLGCQPANSGIPAVGGGGRRLRETRRGTKQMIKDQLIKHFLCEDMKSLASQPWKRLGLQWQRRPANQLYAAEKPRIYLAL